MAHKIFANYSKSENKEKSHQISEKKDTFNYRKNPLALCRCIGNLTINRLLEPQGDVGNKQQNDLNMQGIYPEENFVNMLSAFRKQYGISTPNDPVEHEAESVAKQIVNMKTPDSGQSQGVTGNDSNVWRAPKISRKHQASQNTQNTVNLDLPKSDGQPLERSVSEYMEPRFGYSFQDVRIHASSQSANISHGLNARAFTTGRDIYFGHGEYNSQTNGGKELIAHELTHVIQQGQASQINNITISKVKKEEPKKTVTVNVTKLHGSTRSASTDLSVANSIYNSINIDVKKGSESTINETDSKTILGNDLVLDEYSNPSTPTTEEKNLFKKNQTPGVVTMYFVKKMSMGNTGEAFWPSSGSGLVGFVVTNGTVDNTFAHELGHVLLDSGAHNVPDATYLMWGIDANTRKKIKATQKTKMRSSSYAK